MEDRVIRNLRNMAWERAKGELKSMLHTFWDKNDNFLILDQEIKKFIKKIEDDGLHE